MTQQFESPEAQLKHYSLKVLNMVVRLVQTRWGIEIEDAKKFALITVLPHKGYPFYAEGDLQTADMIIKRLPFNLALDIINQQSHKLKANGKIWMWSEKQISVVENFIVELEREIKLAQILASKKEEETMNIDDTIQAEMKANVEANPEVAAAERPTTEAGAIAPSIGEILRATNAVCEMAKMSFTNPMSDEDHLDQLRKAYESTPEIRRIKMVQIFNFFLNPETAEGDSFYSDDYMEEKYAKWNGDYRKMVEFFENKAAVFWGDDDLNFDNLPKLVEL